ncbi:TetR/AcrR family transcriptional regulator [Actinopolymorpha pittospori]|uniref:AcrR family transcriptional regulator n=1 Tax=Actinopolymorpha pittospori TaxID=648752 RepID=A0A927MTG8_9ACTN|nr:TetR/AcrR family transcriptional regulator [Actinopolymorpha pittospori]MBE1606026.1 AcrR family transcriptional regulator [Actinopolymorpha pittospori]
MTPVKSGGKRAEKTRETRRKIRDAARDLFIEQGYGATMLQDVATRAGVAVQTIYFTFGNKRALLKEVVDVSIAGDDEPLATMERPWFHAVLAARTAPEQLREQVKGVRALLERVAPIIEVVRAAAAADPEVEPMWADPDPRFTVQSATAKALVAKPGVRAGLTADEAADVLYGVLSPELYLLLVRDRGWSSQRWERWVYDVLRGQLCAD